MRLNLRSLFLAPALLAAAALTPQLASAAILHVPFAFTVSGHTLPAGEYTVDRDLHGGYVTLKTADGTQSFNWMIAPGDPDPNSSKVAMRFDVTGSGYVLQSVQYGGMITPKLDKKLHLNEDRPVHVIRGE
jgi:hypothetical protein